MPDLNFEISSAGPKPFAVGPMLAFKLRVTNAPGGEEVFSAALRCQVMIAAVHRGYDTETKGRLFEVFGQPERWEETLNSLLWTCVVVPLPRFAGSTETEVLIPCSPDFEGAAGKYFHAVRDGFVPLLFLWSGTLFYSGPGGRVQVTQLPWEKESAFKLPVAVWRQMMESYYPDTKWVRLSSPTFDRLARYKAAGALPTFDHCLEALLQQASPHEKNGQEAAA